MEALGAVAAVSELAGLVLECGFACVEMYGKIKHASDTVNNQRRQLDELNRAVKKVANSPSLAEDEDIVTVLESCLDALERINRRLSEAAASEQDGRIRLLGKSIVSVANESKVKDLFTRLQSHQLNLMSIMVSIGVESAQSARKLLGDRSSDDPARNLSNDWTHHLPQSRLYDVPVNPVAQFVGREDVIESIDKVLMARDEKTSRAAQRPPVVVLRGMGGQGKSQIAAKYCQLCRSQDVKVIIWIDATSESRLRSRVENIEQRLQAGIRKERSADATIADFKWKLETCDFPWLLVFDNYDDVLGFGSIEEYFPRNGLGSIIVTSRHGLSERLAAGPDDLYLDLSALAENEAADLFFRISGAPRDDKSRGYANKIVAHLAYHPLAVSQAAAVARRRPLSTFLDFYQARKSEILGSSQPLVSAQYRRKLDGAEGETTLNVFTTWELSFQQLISATAADAEASRMSFAGLDPTTNLLVMAAYLGGSRVSEMLFAEYEDNWEVAPDEELNKWLKAFSGPRGWDQERFRDALITLEDLSLIQGYSEVDGFLNLRMHALVRDWLRLRNEAPVSVGYSQKALQLVSNSLKQNYVWRHRVYRMNLAQKECVMMHYTAVVDNLLEFGQVHGAHREGSETLIRTLLHFALTQPRDAAIQEHSRDLAVYALESPHLQDVLSKVPCIRCILRTMPPTSPVYKLADGAIPEVTPKLAARKLYYVIHKLRVEQATALKQQGRLDDALRIEQESARDVADRYGADAYETLSARGLVAQTLSELGRHDEAAGTLRRALGESAGNDKAAVLRTTAQVQYAETLRRAGRVDETVEQLRDAADALERLCGAADHNTLRCLDHLEEVLMEDGRAAEALRVRSRILDAARHHGAGGTSGERRVSGVSTTELAIIMQAHGLSEMPRRLTQSRDK